MDDSSSTTTTLEQADEEILTYTVSDEALEAAARARTGGKRPVISFVSPPRRFSRERALA
jgi:hypothetical protein